MNTEQFIKYFRDGEKPEKDFKMGVEWECFIVDKDNLNLIPYHGTPGVEYILKELSKKLSLKPEYDNGNIISLKGEKFNITLEPAGQIELSSSQFTEIDDFQKELELFIASLKSICNNFNLAIMPTSYHPLYSTEKTSFIPKTRYGHLSESFSKFGQHLAHDMMKLTTSVQGSIDYSSEKDFVKKIQTINQVAPIIIAMYTNSPFRQNSDSGFLSYRGHVWENTDSNRSGFIKGSFDEDFGYEKYVDALINLPMVMGFNNETPSELNNITLKEYMQKNSPDISADEWLTHISFLFTIVRAKQFIETRFYDNQGSPEMILTIPALIKGLFYTSDTIMDKAHNLLNSTLDEAIVLKHSAVKHGLDGKFKDTTILEIAQQIYQIAKEGLESHYKDEVKYITPLEDYLFNKKCSPGKELLTLWEKNGKDILNIKDKLFI